MVFINVFNKHCNDFDVNYLIFSSITSSFGAKTLVGPLE